MAHSLLSHKAILVLSVRPFHPLTAWLIRMNDTLHNAPSRAGWGLAMAKAILIGDGGVVVLFLFLISFLHVLEAIKFVPWIILFNGALTGYTLIDKTREKIRRRVVAAAFAGFGCALIACVVLSMVNFLITGDIVFAASDLALFLAVGVCASTLGAILAIKFYRLKSE
jgi:hypothetical protein